MNDELNSFASWFCAVLFIGFGMECDNLGAILWFGLWGFLCLYSWYVSDIKEKPKAKRPKHDLRDHVGHICDGEPPY